MSLGNTVAVSPADPRFFEETDNQHREMENNNQCLVVRDLVKTFQAHGLTTYAVQGRVERFDRRGTEPFEPFEPFELFEPFEFFQNRNFP